MTRPCHDSQTGSAPPDLRSTAERLRADEPALVSSLDFGPYVAQGIGSGPSVIIGDPSEISLLDASTGGNLEYRMSLLARAKDIVLVRQRDRVFEDYLAKNMDMPDVTFLEVGRGHDASIAHLARKTHWLIAHLAHLAAESGGLTLKPYLATGHVWHLAHLIGEVAQTKIHVSGPSPRVARRANDKLWFAQMVHRLLGSAATPPTFSSYGPAATAALVAHVAKTADRVVVKVPDSAGSLGNINLFSADIVGRSLADVRDLLLDRVRACGWKDTYPVLVGVWDTDVVSSPSVQLWIPDTLDGPPICEAVFEQSVVGKEGKFVGATRASLPRATQAELTEQAVLLASVLQRIGYFGRCSLDAVIQRRGSCPDVIHWIECNGRWGGVSIPLSVLRGRWDAVPTGVAIAQIKLPDVHLTTSEALNRLDGLLSVPGQHGLIVTTPAAVSDGTLFSACAVAGTETAAQAFIAEGVSRLRTPDAI